MTKEENIDEIMKHNHEDIIREILVGMDDFRVSWIRQRFRPRWQDGYWDREFTPWYKHKAQNHFTQTNIPDMWKCNLCGDLWDYSDGDIFVNHFRYGQCSVLTDIFNSGISEDSFLRKIKELNNDKNKNCNTRS
jgi:hypothetical protein